jgi:uncharacterized protein (DUF58 family)
MPGLSAFIIPAALAAAIAGAVAGEPLVAALAGLAVVVLFVSRLWSRLSLEDLQYERTVSTDRLFVGDEFEFVLTITNGKPLPLPWLHVRDHVPHGLDVLGTEARSVHYRQAYSLSASTSLAWYERVRFRYDIRASRRGYYRFGPANLESGDLFGLHTREERYEDTGPAVIVYPVTVPLPDLDLPSARPIGDSRSGPRMWEDPSLPSSLREYRAGDPVKHIDWKATARHREVRVRTYDPSAIHHVVVATDLATVRQPWEGVYSPYLERAVTAAASVVMRAFELGYHTGLITNGFAPAETARTAAIPGSGTEQLALILEALAMVRPITSGSIENLIDRQQDWIPYGATVVAVSPLFQDGLRDKLSDLKSRGHPVMAIHVGEPFEPDRALDYPVLCMGDVFDLELREERELFKRPVQSGTRAGFIQPGLENGGSGSDV